VAQKTPGRPEVPKDGLKPDHADIGERSASLVPLYLRPGFLALPSLLATALAGGWLVRRRRATGQGARGARRGSAPQIEQVLRELQAAARQGDARTFFTLARAALEERPHAGLAAEDDIREILALADEASYSGTAPSTTDFQRWIDIVRRAAQPAAWLLLGAWLALCPAQRSAAAAAAAAPTGPAAAAADSGYSAAALYNQGNGCARASLGSRCSATNGRGC
jgi:hypothetical protein